MEDWRVTILVVLAGIQLLLVPAYRSTDFEVHRNWLAITHSLPLSKWYREATSEWTLDYPPLFAWFERLMAPLAALADPRMLEVDNLEHASAATVLFQRLSVMATGLLLPAAAWRAAERGGIGGGGGVGGSGGSGDGGVSGGRIGPTTAGARTLRGQLLFFLLAANAGLLLVDNIHFQYNGVLMGLMAWSLLAAGEGRFVASGVLFAALLNMKHLFAYMAPAYFVFLLKAYVLGGGGGGGGGGGQGGGGGGWWGRLSAVPPPTAAARLAALGAAVLAVFAASVGPVAATGQLGAMLGRLFPFGRGLCHAYWAPNAWALYSLADKLLATGLSRLGLSARPAVGHMAGGVVGAARFAVLPQVGPGASAAAVLLALAPSLAALWRRPGRRGAIVAAAAYANLCGFVWGFHVHEKAIIAVTVPLALLAVDGGGGDGGDGGDSGRAWAADFLLLAAAGHAALFPLLFGAAEAPVKWIAVAAYYLVAAAGLGRLHGGGGSGGTSRSSRSSSSRRGRDGDGGEFLGWESVGAALPRAANAYVAGLVPLELYCSLVHRPLLAGRLPFLPLMLTSCYCAVGVLWVWGRQCLWYLRGCPPRVA